MNKELILKKIKRSLPQQLLEELGLTKKKKKKDDQLQKEDLVPPVGAQKAAKKGLEMWAASGNEGTCVAKERAEKIAKGEAISVDSLRRMASFFSREEISKGSDEDAEAQEMKWLLWGGREGKRWSLDLIEKSGVEKEEIAKMDAEFHFDPGSHGHALARNMMMTMRDGRHMHYFTVPLVNGETLILRSEYDGEHAHGLEDFKSTKTESVSSIHQHVIRIPFDVTLTTGEELEAGQILLTQKDGFHEHEADHLHHTSSAGAHVHDLILSDSITVNSVDIEKYFELYGFEIAKEGEEELGEVMLGIEEGPEVSDDKRAALAVLGFKVTKEKKISAFGRKTVQEVRFAKSKFKNRNDIEIWLGENGYPTPDKINEAGGNFIARLRAPSEFVEKTMKEISIGGGIKVVTGMRKEDVDMDLVEKQTEIQTLIFDKKKFTEDKAKKWAKDNDFSASKVDETSSSFRYRQQDPDKFSRLRTVSLTEGVKAVVGVTKSETKKEDTDPEGFHVDDPTGKIKESVNAEILKADEEKQEILGIVLEPEETDAQNHVISAEEIEKAQRFHMQKSRVIGFRHSKKEKADLVESYIAPADFTISGQNGKQKVKKGSWLVTVKVHDKKKWKMVKEKKINAFSVGGFSDLEDEAS